MGNKQPKSPSTPGNTNDERGNGTQRKVAEYWSKYGGKYNVMCILAGNSYNIDQLKGMQANEVSFNNVLSHSSIYNIHLVSLRALTYMYAYMLLLYNFISGDLHCWLQVHDLRVSLGPFHQL